MSKIVVEINTLSAGQPRPYADHEFKADISLEYYWTNSKGEDVLGTMKLTEDNAKELARMFVRNFEDNPQYWYQPFLAKLEEVYPGVWRALVVERYTD